MPQATTDYILFGIDHTVAGDGRAGCAFDELMHRIESSAPGKAAGLIRLTDNATERQLDEALLRQIARWRPRAVLGFGATCLAPELEHEPSLLNAVRVERLALNYRDGGPIDETGQTGYLSCLDLEALVGHLNRHGIDAVLSHFAGTQACNRIYYRVLQRLARENLPVAGALLHLPLFLFDRASSSPPAVAPGWRTDRLAAAVLHYLPKLGSARPSNAFADYAENRVG